MEKPCNPNLITTDPIPKILFDTEEKRYIDRIRAVAWREARDAGAKFINKKWIARRLQRSTEFVKHNWSKTYAECKTTFGGGRPQKLSEESVALVRELSKGAKRKSSVLIAKELETRTNEKISRTTVMRYQKKFNSRDSSRGAAGVQKIKAPRKSRSKKKLVLLEEQIKDADMNMNSGKVKLSPDEDTIKTESSLESITNRQLEEITPYCGESNAPDPTEEESNNLIEAVVAELPSLFPPSTNSSQEVQAKEIELAVENNFNEINRFIQFHASS